MGNSWLNLWIINVRKEVLLLATWLTGVKDSSLKIHLYINLSCARLEETLDTSRILPWINHKFGCFVTSSPKYHLRHTFRHTYRHLIIRQHTPLSPPFVTKWRVFRFIRARARTRTREKEITQTRKDENSNTKGRKHKLVWTKRQTRKDVKANT